MKRIIGVAASLALVLSVGAAQAAERWDMPMAYADSNYHTENARLFAEAVDVCTDGALVITVHGRRVALQGR